MKKILLPALSILLFPLQSQAAIINLVDDNSTFSIDDSSTESAAWTVDGQDQLEQQQLFYRIGPTGGEKEFSSLILSSSTLSSNRFLELTYTDNDGLTIDMTYVLNGGLNGSGVSDLAVNIDITNTTGDGMEFHLFQYNDFDLLGTASGDTAEQTNPNTVRQWEGVFGIQESVGTPAPDHHEIALFNSTLASLLDGSPTTLSDASGPLSGDDITWAWQWDFVIANDDTVQISKDLRMSIEDTSPVPVPAAMWLFGSGLLGLVGIARRKPSA